VANSSRWLKPLGCVALLALAACGGGGTDTSPGQAGVNGGAGTSGAAGAGGSAGGAAGTSAGGAGASGNGGATSTGAGGSVGGSASAGRGGSAGSSSGGAAGNVARGGAGGTTSTGGAGVGGAAVAGSGGMAAAGRGGSAGGAAGGTGGTSTACTRELLKSTISAYFTALAARDSSTLPLASNVKFTENGRVMTLGTGGLWSTAGMVKHTQSALDVDQCTSATHAVVPEGNMDIPLALRLKLQNQKITEIETIAVRPGDYSLGANNPAAIITAAATIKWEEAPTGTRATRAELTAWMDKYFRMFPRGVCNTTSACRRLENGGGNFVCTGGGGSCDPGQPSGTPVMTPRLILADVDTGIGVGFTMFMGNTDMHMFKMYGGQVHAVHAILGAASSSGW